jgi:predicted PolB exonuclease-like 3'-5' exonuclease
VSTPVRGVNVLAFDIETVPDTDAGRRIHGLDGLDDDDVAKVLFAQRVAETGRDFLRLHQQRIVAVSVVLRHADQVRVWSLGTPQSPEAELIRRFFEGLERYNPVLVSWNGGGFDLPVLQYRALLHGIEAPHYWESGENDREFRFNNYRNRYHDRHTDLMDVLASFQARATVPLESLALALGLPGKMGMHGSEVWSQFQQGNIGAIRDYCETDALNTYLVYLRFELIRGHLTPAQFRLECQLVYDFISAQDSDHWREFVSLWHGFEQWMAHND